MSHSPLLNLPGPSQDLLDDIEGAIAEARRFVADYDPELVVIFSPDHYNGFFYKVMPPFCIGMRAAGVGDYGTHVGPLDVPLHPGQCRVMLPQQPVDLGLEPRHLVGDVDAVRLRHASELFDLAFQLGDRFFEVEKVHGDP